MGSAAGYAARRPTVRSELRQVRATDDRTDWNLIRASAVYTDSTVKRYVGGAVGPLELTNEVPAEAPAPSRSRATRTSVRNLHVPTSVMTIA